MANVLIDESEFRELVDQLNKYKELVIKLNKQIDTYNEYANRINKENNDKS